MLHKPNSMSKTVIDGTLTVLAVHQSHPWSHNNEKAQKMKGHNAKLANNQWFFGNTERASHYSDYCDKAQMKGTKKICIKKRSL